jgi:hypothetical protein
MRILLYPLFALGLFGADWPQLRGPNGTGLCPSCGQLPTEFGPQKNVLWKMELPEGRSSPVLVGGRIFLTARSAFGTTRLLFTSLRLDESVSARRRA